jgi:Cys-rich protein (TIGR04453 family)
MKHLKLLITISLLCNGLIGLSAQNFPKCPAACGKYYSCVVEKNPNATEEQKNMLKKGCEFNCNRAKYYGQISACYDKSGSSCKTYWDCITKAVQK